MICFFLPSVSATAVSTSPSFVLSTVYTPVKTYSFVEFLKEIFRPLPPWEVADEADAAKPQKRRVAAR